MIGQFQSIHSSPEPTLTAMAQMPPFSTDSATAAADVQVPATPAFSPLYQQIKGLILQSLEAGEWKPGEAIPSEMDLAARLRVSQGTVRKAIDELAAEHILMRRQGKGTFVASHSEPSYQYRFLRVTPDSGEKPHPQNLFFGLERGKASGDAAHALGLKAGTPTVGFRRLMSFAGRPV